jgi:plastocyanin
MSRRRVLLPALTLATLTAALALPGCGGGSSSTTTPTAPSNPTATTTITITASGASPQHIQIAPGSRVTIVNSDTRAHNMTSNPHPEHTDCPELNQVGLLTPGQSRQSGNLNTARVCGFHDHDLPAVANLIGTITIR